MSPRRADAGFAVLALLAGSPRALADRCAPRARVTGDDAVATPVAAELRRLGVELGAPTAACAGVDADVRGDGHGGVTVTLRDGSRSDARDVGEPAVAAAWIDAWLRDDLDWRADPTPPAATPARVAAIPTDDGPPDRVAPAASRPETGLLAHASFAAGYTQAWTGDGAAWSGVAIAASVHAGAWALGGRAGFAEQTFALGETGVARSDTSVLATAAYRLALGRLVVAPELGVGGGLMSSSRAEACAPPQQPCETGDPSCSMPPPPMRCADGHGAFVGDHLQASTFAPRAAAAVRVEVPLFAHVWLAGIASIEVAPFGHGDPFAATKGAPGVPADQLALPGEPLAAFQLGVGLRVGAL